MTVSNGHLSQFTSILPSAGVYSLVRERLNGNLPPTLLFDAVVYALM